MSIPSELGGLIIGKGGEHVRRVREESGTHIVIAPSTDNRERSVTISGTPAQIQNAQWLIQQWSVASGGILE
jgi:malonyl CoA-acyl carrier protein transacylase